MFKNTLKYSLIAILFLVIIFVCAYSQDRGIGIGAVDATGGVIVTDVLSYSIADKAGIKRDDLIFEFDGKKVYSTKELTNAIAQAPTGKEFEVLVLRKNHIVKITLKFEKKGDEYKETTTNKEPSVKVEEKDDKHKSTKSQPTPTREKSEKANTISVVGRGATKEEAIQDALKTAVEKATGVFIYSVTEVRDFDEIKEKIVAQSRGYVKDYKIKEDRSFEGLVVLIIDVTVDAESIKNIMRKDIKAVTFDDAFRDYALVTQKQQRLRKSVELLKAITSRPIEEMYNIDYVGYEITDIGLEYVRGNFLVRIALNNFFWDTYEKILEQISEKEERRKVYGLGKCHKYLYPSYGKEYAIHPDLAEYERSFYGRGGYGYCGHCKELIINFILPNNEKGGGSCYLHKNFVGEPNKANCDCLESQLHCFENSIVLKFPFNISDSELIKRFSYIKINCYYR